MSEFSSIIKYAELNVGGIHCRPSQVLSSSLTVRASFSSGASDEKSMKYLCKDIDASPFIRFQHCSADKGSIAQENKKNYQV